MPWTEERKVIIAKALAWDYTSSDESDMSEDENGLTCLKGYNVKKLSWEKTTLRNAKKALDDAYIKSLPPRVRANVLEWRVHHTPSKRGPPPDALQWAVRILTRETPPATPAVIRRLETPAARAAPTRTDNPLRMPCTSPSPVTPRATPTVTRPLEKPTARTAPTRPDNPFRTPTCASQSPVTPRTTPSTKDSPVEQRARGTLETPRIPARIAAPRTVPTQTRGKKKKTVHRQLSRSPVY